MDAHQNGSSPPPMSQNSSSPPRMSLLTPATSPAVQLPRPVQRATRKRKRSAQEPNTQLRITRSGKLFQTGKNQEEDEATKSSHQTQKGTSQIATQLQAEKPAPFGPPPVSGAMRGAICNALPYYRSHQGGVYTQKKVAYGMYINAEVEVRDQFLSQVIITTIGGGRTRDHKTGKMVLAKSQDGTSIPFQGLMNAYKDKSPVAMIAGNGNRLFPVKTEHYINVLDYFHVTDIWAEAKTDEKGQLIVYYMVRLEKVDLNTRSWWTPQDGPEPDKYAVGEYKCAVKICSVCENSSKHIFREGWVCLNRNCPQFLSFGRAVPLATLQYNDNFLRERTLYTGAGPKYPLVPGLPSPLPVQSRRKFGTEREYKEGIVCPRCRFASRRVKWEGWECENPKCDFSYTVPMREVPLEQIMDETLKLQAKKPIPVFVKHGDVLMTEHMLKGYKVRTFYLPGNPKGSSPASIVGSVSIFRPHATTCTKPGGPNDLFMAMQQSLKDGEIKLRRNAARTGGHVTEEITSHFSCNIGAHYKFGVVVETSSGFDKAAAPVLEALGRLTWAGKDATSRVSGETKERKLDISKEFMESEFKDFNEELILGYFQGSRISYHDDGEKELGPTVATLSLGSPSIMKFRPKKTTNIGELSNDKEGNRKSVLEFTLGHGDMVVMHGREIHKFYEHSVDAAGVLRYAMTCRYIRPEQIANTDLRRESIKNGMVPEEWKRKLYQGEEDEVEDMMEEDEMEDDEADDMMEGDEMEEEEVVEESSTTAEQPDAPQSNIDTNLNGEALDAAQATDTTIDVDDSELEIASDSPGVTQGINQPQIKDAEDEASSSPPTREFISSVKQIYDIRRTNPSILKSLSKKQLQGVANVFFSVGNDALRLYNGGNELVSDHLDIDC